MKALPFLVFALCLAAGCSKGGFSKRGSGDSGTLRYALPDNPTTLDPGRVQDTETMDVLQNVFEGLVGYDENNRVLPVLAEKWTVENGGRTYVFTLKAASFHDGGQVTADDVRWTLERNVAEDFQSPIARDYLSDIEGVAEYSAGKAARISGIEVVDDRVLKLTLDKPKPYFLGKLTYPCAFVLSRKSAGREEFKDVRQAVGTGPYRFEEYLPGQSVTLAAFPDYHRGAPRLKRIVRPILKDPSTRLSKFKSGELEYVSLPRQDLAAVHADPSLKSRLQFLPRPTFFYIGANPRQYAPFKDRRVRRAMAMAIDRQKLADEILGEVPAACGIVPPGVPGHREGARCLPYDPEAAKRELAAAGYPGGKGLPPLTITIRDQAVDFRLGAEAIASDLQKNLNWPVKVRTMEFRSLFEARNAKKLPCYHGNWSADYLDPQNFLSMILSGEGSLNFDSYSNPEFDRLCALADIEQDEPKRLKLYAQAEDIALQDAARTPVYYGRDAILVSPRVSNLKLNLFGLMPHRTTEVGSPPTTSARRAAVALRSSRG
ncbi:MAG TPA: peptide ABC transporter substrate-binding protein [Fimbriimonas sp.]